MPTPLALVVGGGVYDLPVCGPPASFTDQVTSSAVTPAESINPRVSTWCVCECSLRDDVCCMHVLQKGHSGDGYELASTILFRAANV